MIITINAAINKNLSSYKLPSNAIKNNNSIDVHVSEIT